MDITALSTSLSQANIQQAASIQVQKLAMNSAEAQGAGIIQMMTSSIADPAMGNNVDILA